jgi:hypothetical protein
MQIILIPINLIYLNFPQKPFRFMKFSFTPFPGLLKIKARTVKYCEPGSSVGTVSDYGLDDRAIEVRSPAETKGLFL